MNKALSILKEARSYRKTDEKRASAMLCKALKIYLSQYFHKNEEGFTPADARTLLAESKLSGNDSLLLANIFERHFNVFFDKTSSDLSMTETDLEMAEELINKLKRL